VDRVISLVIGVNHRGLGIELPGDYTVAVTLKGKLNANGDFCKVADQYEQGVHYQL
jgi:hypothetical protein